MGGWVGGRMDDKLMRTKDSKHTGVDWKFFLMNGYLKMPMKLRWGWRRRRRFIDASDVDDSGGGGDDNDGVGDDDDNGDDGDDNDGVER